MRHAAGAAPDRLDVAPLRYVVVVPIPLGMPHVWISKDPEHYRYSPPPERRQLAATVLTLLFAVALSIPVILDAIADGWDLGTVSLKAIAIGAGTVLARRALNVVVDRARRWARTRWRAPAWEPSRNPDDYR